MNDVQRVCQRSCKRPDRLTFSNSQLSTLAPWVSLKTLALSKESNFPDKNFTWAGQRKVEGWSYYSINNLRSLLEGERDAKCHPTRMTNRNFSLHLKERCHLCPFCFSPAPDRKNLITAKFNDFRTEKESESRNGVESLFESRNSTTWIVIKSLKSLMAHERGKG